MVRSKVHVTACANSKIIAYCSLRLYLAWLMAFLAFFFVRASVMLFTLRLLPRTKRRSQWIIIGAFTLNVAITLIAMISFGLQCEPFSAIWNPRPGAKCAAPQVLTVSNRVNGGMCLALPTSIGPTLTLAPSFSLHHRHHDGMYTCISPLESANET